MTNVAFIFKGTTIEKTFAQSTTELQQTIWAAFQAQNVLCLPTKDGVIYIDTAELVGWHISNDD